MDMSVINNIHKIMVVVFAELKRKNPGSPDVKDMINNLLEGSNACLTGIATAVTTAYNRLFIVENLGTQIQNLLLSEKESALDTYIRTKYPSSIDPLVLSNPTKAQEHFAHMKNTFIASLGKELGFGASRIDAAKSDPHINVVLHK